jgi:hypothetical protein
LKLRMAMTLADVERETAIAAFEEANVFQVISV